MTLPKIAPWLLVCTFVLLPMSPGGAFAGSDGKEVPTRDQIPDKYKWDLRDIYPTREAWEADFKKVEEMIEKLGELKGTLSKSPQDLLAALQLRDEAGRIIARLNVYARQASDLDTSNSEMLALAGRARTLGVNYDGATSWMDPELLKIPEETLLSWAKSNKALAVYKHSFEDIIRQKPHTLSAREEELLAMAGNMAAAPTNAYTVLNNAELNWPTVHNEEGEEVTLSHGRFNKFTYSQNRDVRKEAFLGQMQAYELVENTMAALLNGAVQRDLYYARARNFDSTLEAALFPNNIPVSVFMNLVDTIRENHAVQHRYAALRKKVMGVDELHVWDLYQSLVPDVDKEIAYEDAVKTVIAALPVLGDEYNEPMKEGFRSHWIDVYETKDKRSGGYSSGAYDTHPFILLNYNKTLDEVSTIAHEMGHAMHRYLTNKHQPFVYSGNPIFVAEVASTFNEILLHDYLLKNTTDPKERLYLLNYSANQLLRTVFRQTMFAEFELRCHELAERGETLTADTLGKIYVDTFHEYWGPDLVRDEEQDPYWARIPHFYRNYYVYQYATSYCAAAALAEKVLAEEPGAVERYLNLLKSGSSDYPIEVLKKAGVDMTTPEPIEATIRRFDQLVDEMEKMLLKEGKKVARTD
jgi:oligoendopeptidase F